MALVPRCFPDLSDATPVTQSVRVRRAVFRFRVNMMGRRKEIIFARCCSPVDFKVYTVYTPSIFLH